MEEKYIYKYNGDGMEAQMSIKNNSNCYASQRACPRLARILLSHGRINISIDTLVDMFNIPLYHILGAILRVLCTSTPLSIAPYNVTRFRFDNAHVE